MTKDFSDGVCFELLLRSAGTGTTPRPDTVQSFRPPAEAVEKCRRWMVSAGAECHATEFSVVCYMPVAAFEDLFEVRLEPEARARGTRVYRAEREVPVPAELAPLVEQISLTRPPELF